MNVRGVHQAPASVEETVRRGAERFADRKRRVSDVESVVTENGRCRVPRGGTGKAGMLMFVHRRKPQTCFIYPEVLGTVEAKAQGGERNSSISWRCNL